MKCKLWTVDRGLWTAKKKQALHNHSVDPVNPVYMVKRAFDLVASLAALVPATPVLVVMALLIRKRMGSPIFFKQVRPGKGGKPFRIIKFRTMLDTRGPDGKWLPDSERLTPLGGFLRSTSLDELPELLNVLKGDMSIVGPRPLLMQYLERYTPEQARRHEVKPGLTGWAQVNGRNAITWEEKFRLDVWYVDHWSLLLDVKIILMTVLKVLKREGISADGEATMREFFGPGPENVDRGPWTVDQETLEARELWTLHG